jgi:phosphatidylglycerol:prolipoprotein diacylglycerol transferase
MLDLHWIPNNTQWGVRPILFSVGSFHIPSYTFFVGLAIAVGAYIYYREARGQKTLNDQTFYVVIAALVGGALGAKLPIWVFHFSEIVRSFPDINTFLSGRTIVGGLIGGTISVMIVKKYIGMKEKKGNLFAPAIALGIAIGRLGCYLRGCCFGVTTSLPWGVDFGDGVHRHPTELYEALFALSMFFYLLYAKKRNPAPGQLFRTFMISYFSFRFFIEFIRTESIFFGGLTGFQWASLFVLLYYVLTTKKVLQFITNNLIPWIQIHLVGILPNSLVKVQKR